MLFQNIKKIDMYGKIVEIKKIKNKELNNLMTQLNIEGSNIISAFDGKKFNILNFINARMDFIKNFILKYTSITDEEFNDLYSCDTVEILKIIIEFNLNGMKIETIKDFFLKLTQIGEKKKEKEENTLFVEKIPEI